MKHSAQLVTLSAQRLAYGSMPLELAETRPRSNFPESRNAFSKVRSAKLYTDVTILMPGTEYFGETALNPRSGVFFFWKDEGKRKTGKKITPDTFIERDANRPLI